jgi:hypothetical protein
VPDSQRLTVWQKDLNTKNPKEKGNAKKCIKIGSIKKND